MGPIPVSGKEIVVEGTIYFEVSPVKYAELDKVPLYRLRPHERVVGEKVIAVANDIKERGVKTPLPVSRWLYRKGEVPKYWDVVLNGHHRLAALNLLADGGEEIDFAPVQIVPYTSEHVQLQLWPGADRARITKEEVVIAGIKGDLMPIKTTRHIFDPALPERPTPLAQLRSPNRRAVRATSFRPPEQ